MLNIIRSYPLCKEAKNVIEYPNRTSIYDVNNIKDLSKNQKYNDDYKKWNNGMNYEKNNKIKIGGNLHNKLGEKFKLKHATKFTKHNNYVNNNINYIYNYKYILFTDIDNINWYEYFLETQKIYEEIDKQNESIFEYNKKIIEYNDEIDKIIKQINKLEKWEEFVVFEEKKYGINNIYNNIHRENDCFGNIIPDYIERTTIKCECSSCENWGGCGRNGAEDVIQYYKCDNCNYKNNKWLRCNYNDNYKSHR
jgi:hypothetical protein